MNFASEIERARTMLQTYYRSVTVSASMAVGIPSKSIFISVKTPQWEQDMEWRPENAPDYMSLSEWICEEVLTAPNDPRSNGRRSRRGGVMANQERVQYIYDLTKCAIIDIRNGRLAPNAILTIMQDIQAEMIALGAKTPTTVTEILFNGGNSTGQAKERE